MSLGYKLLLLSCTCVYPGAMKIPETIQEKIDNLDYIKKKIENYSWQDNNNNLRKVKENPSAD